MTKGRSRVKYLRGVKNAGDSKPRRAILSFKGDDGDETRAYKKDVVACVRSALGKRKGITEKQIFGGLTFMVKGNMCCGVTKNDDLVLRLGQSAAKKLPSKNMFDRVTSLDIP